MTLPHNGGSRVSEDLKFKNFPDPPYRGAAFGDPIPSNPLNPRQNSMFVRV